MAEQIGIPNAAQRAMAWWNEVFREDSPPKTDPALMQSRIVCAPAQLAASFLRAGFDPDRFRPDWDATVGQLIACKFGRSRGFLVRGQTGCGKSTLLSAIERLCRGNCIRINCADAAHSDWMDWEEVRDRARQSRYLLIDDLGSDEVARVYGEVRDRVATWIKLWGSWADLTRDNKRGAPMMIVTTNLNADQVRARYGERIYSVLRYLVPIVWHGGDARNNGQTP